MTSFPQSQCNRKVSVSSLHVACAKGRLNDVISCLDQDSTILASISEDDGGNTGLHYACASGHLDIVKCLLKRGAPLDQLNDEGWTPLMQACYAGHSDVVSALIQSQADVNIVNRSNCTALTLGCFNGSERIVRLLIESGAQFLPPKKEPNNHQSQESYFNPMLAACVRGNVEALRELMNAFHSVALKMKDSYNGQTPLSLSAIFNWTQLVEILLKEGADTTAVDANNRTALDLASMCKSRQSKAILKAKTDKQSAALAVEVHPIEHPIIEMAKQGNLKSLRDALENDPNLIHARNTEDGATVLMYACVAGHLSIVRLLVSKGANLDERDVLSGWTALMQATYHNKADIVRYLIESGADVSIRSHQDISAFDIASLMDDIIENDIISLLASNIGNGVDSRASGYSSALNSARDFEYLSTSDRLKASHRTNSTPVINRLNRQQDEDAFTNGNLKTGNSGSVKNLWNKFTDKLKDIKIGRTDMNRVSAMPINDAESSFIEPQVGGWVSIHDQPSRSDMHFNPGDDSALDSGIFSTPSMYSMQNEPIHVQTTKQLAPVLPPFHPVPSSIDSSRKMQLSRHKSSFTKGFDRNSSGYPRRHKPIKANPPKFLQPKKSNHNLSNSGSSNSNQPVKFEASEHSNYMSPQSSGDMSKRQQHLLLTSSRVNQSLFQTKPNFGNSQHVASPLPLQSTSSGYQLNIFQSSTNNNNIGVSNKIDQGSKSNSGVHGRPRIGSFGSSISSGEVNWSHSTNLNPKNSRTGATPRPSNDAGIPSSPVMSNVKHLAMGSGHWSSPRNGGTDGRSSFESSVNTADDVMSSNRLNLNSTSNGTKSTNPSEMSQILSELALMKYKHIFDQQEVDREVLFSLTEDDLDEMGIGQTTNRQQILSAINVYKNKKTTKGHNKENSSTSNVGNNKQNNFLTVQNSHSHKQKLRTYNENC